MYQKCPVCNGSGYAYNPYAMGSETTCPTCEGARIIDEVTGLPPEGQIPKYQTITSDQISLKLGEQ